MNKTRQPRLQKRQKALLQDTYRRAQSVLPRRPHSAPSWTSRQLVHRNYKGQLQRGKRPKPIGIAFSSFNSPQYLVLCPCHRGPLFAAIKAHSLFGDILRQIVFHLSCRDTAISVEVSLTPQAEQEVICDYPVLLFARPA